MAYTEPLQAISINIRAKSRQRDLIDRAAARVGRSRSDFMLDAACREAENLLLDQTFFMVSQKTFADFQEMLAHPLPPTDKLRRLLQVSTPWQN